MCPYRSYHHPQISTSPPHNNRHHISRHTTQARTDAKYRERGARGAAPTTIGNVINHVEAAVEEAVEEAEAQRNPTTTINPKEVAEEAQPPTSGTTAEEQGAVHKTSGTNAVADSVGRQCNHIPTHRKYTSTYCIATPAYTTLTMPDGNANTRKRPTFLMCPVTRHTQWQEPQ